MSVRQRTTKIVARRHDLNYFKRMSPLRAWQWWLAAAALLVAGVWFGRSTFVHGDAAFSAGPMSSSHAVFGQRCELCHVPVLRSTRWTPAFGMLRRVPDSACLSCHVATPHHPLETTANPTCASCHIEHTGSMHLAAVADRNCTQCHAQLESRRGVLRVAASIHNFGSDHPDFRALRLASPAERAAAFALRFNHAGHMLPGLSSPNGPVTLQCSSCHVPALGADGRRSGGMVPVSFEKSCRSCHSLDFDTHVQQQAPHAAPEVVRAFVAQSVAAFAQAHPQVVSAEIQRWPAQAPLPGRVAMPAPRTPQEWIANRTERAELILWREKCSLCHRDQNPESRAAFTLASIPLPQIEPTLQPQHWFNAAVFNHAAHQAEACAECHAGALTSSSGADVLLPSIDTCRRCHDGQSSPQGPPLKDGHAESGCFLCHVYHGPEDADLTTAGYRLNRLLKR